MSSPPKITPVTGRADLRRFLAVARGVLGDDPAWVPPLTMERLRHLDPRHNPYFQHAEAAFWIAWRGDRPVGRISAQIDRLRAAGEAEATGHFGFLDAEDDAAVFRQLLTTAETWLRQRGARSVTGPFSLSINDESGLLVEGFETPPVVMMGHAKPYYARHVEACGYRKIKDLLAYRYELNQEPPEAVRAFTAKVAKENALTFRGLDPKAFRAEIARVGAIFNDAWAGNWGFVPFSDADLRYLAHNVKPLLRPGDVAFGEVAGETAAMAICLPNINEAVRDLGGRLLPFGWARALWRLKVKGTRSARVPLMGVARRYQGTAVSAALMLGVIERIRADHRRRGTRWAELSWILEDNAPMRKMIERLGGVTYKTYRIYGKEIA